MTCVLPVNFLRELEVDEQILYSKLYYLMFNYFFKEFSDVVPNEEYIEVFESESLWSIKDFTCCRTLYVDGTNLILTCWKNGNNDILERLKWIIRTELYKIVIYLRYYECEGSLKYYICNGRLESVINFIEFCIPIVKIDSVMRCFCTLLEYREDKIDFELLNEMINVLKLFNSEFMITLIDIMKANVGSNEELRTCIIKCDNILSKLNTS